MATLPDIPLDEDLIEIYKRARDDIARHVYDAVKNGERVDISETLKVLSELKIDQLTHVTMKLSRELLATVHNKETEEILKGQYQECLTQIFNQQISPQVAQEFNSNTDAAIKTLISSQYNRTYIQRNTFQETNVHNMTRIGRIEELTQHLLSQKIDIESGKTITYGQLQARELLIKELTKTQGKKQTKVLIGTIEEKTKGYKEKQTKGQEATSTVNDPSNEATAPTRNQSVLASKNMNLLGEAQTLVLKHYKHGRENNNP